MSYVVMAEMVASVSEVVAGPGTSWNLLTPW